MALQQQTLPSEITGSGIDASGKLSGFARLRLWSSSATAIPLCCAHVLIALLFAYSLAFATHFTFRFEPIHYMDHYRYLANGFAHLHVYATDASGKPIPTGCTDCVNYYGKVYYPYGPVPAIIQLVLINLFKSHITDGAIVWAICAVSLYAMFWISRWYAEKILYLSPAPAAFAASAVVAVVATTDIFLHTSTVPYSWSESCASAQLLNLVSAFLLMRAVHSGKTKFIVWSGVLCGLSFLCKQNYLPGFLAGCAFLLWTGRQRQSPRYQIIRRVLMFLMPVALCVGVLLFYNYARFGSVLQTGFQYLNASEAHPQRYQMPQPHRIPYNFYNHFLAGVQIRTSDFPFVLGKSSAFGGINHKDGSGGLLHNFPSFSVFISMPMLLLLVPAVLYAIALLLRNRASPAWEYFLYLVALWCCVFGYFLNESGSFMRYEYDMPFLLGICVLQVVVFVWRAAGRIREISLRKSVRAGFAIVLGLCFLEQAVLGADQTAGLFLTRTDKFLHWQAAERTSDFAVRQRAQAIRSALFDPIGVDMNDMASNAQSERFRIDVTLPEHPANNSEPLLQFGSVPGAADILGIRYRNGRQISLLFDHWGSPLCESVPQIPSLEHEQLIEAIVDPADGRVLARWNGRLVMDCTAGAFADAGKPPVLGKNTLGFTTVGPAFSGSIVKLPNQP